VTGVSKWRSRRKRGGKKRRSGGAHRRASACLGSKSAGIETGKRQRNVRNISTVWRGIAWLITVSITRAPSCRARGAPRVSICAHKYAYAQRLTPQRARARVWLQTLNLLLRIAQHVSRAAGARLITIYRSTVSSSRGVIVCRVLRVTSAPAVLSTTLCRAHRYIVLLYMLTRHRITPRNKTRT